MFVCAAVADPHPLFVFRFNGENITFNSSERTLVANSTHATLTLLNLQGTDEGTYTCSVSNRYGSVSTAAVLTVQGVLWLHVPMYSLYKCVALLVHVFYKQEQLFKTGK